MTFEKKIKATSLVIIFFSIVLVGLSYLGFWIESYVDIFIIIASVSVGIVLLGLLLLRLVTIIRTRNKKLLIPFLIGLLAIFIVTFHPVEFIIEKLKSPVALSGYCEHPMITYSIKLRQDSSFECSGSWASKNGYFGKYSLSADTVNLFFNGYQPEYYSGRLLFSDNRLEEIRDSTHKHFHSFRLIKNELMK